MAGQVQKTGAISEVAPAQNRYITKIAGFREAIVAKKYNHKGCFDFFRVEPRNLRWSWSGRSLDGQTVAVTLWQDKFEEGGRVYRSWKTDRPGEWKSRPGFVELIENLVYARDNLGGHVSVILAVPADKDATPRSIKHCFPQPQLKMRVVELDEFEGTFKLERCEPVVVAVR